ncbi:MAG TPA: response regulator [Isosphaeraceae bacterium]|jgi:CheY-like chemotaxis protein|nr:response regulator [Isosphaeraceae bacterium]
MTAMMTSQRPNLGTSSGRRVLIVEDDPNSRWALCALLKRLGFDCRAATNGQEALDLVRAFQPEAVIMDLMMPVLDGVEATRRLKADARTRGIPVLALSANATPGGRSAARRAGADDFLTKPVILTELLEHLHRHLDA